MIAKMSFGQSRPLAFLRTLGRVFAIRDFEYRTDTAKVPQLRGEIVKRKLIKVFRDDDPSEEPAFLAAYVKESGFDRVDDWLDAAAIYRTDATKRRPFYLYQVWRSGGLPRTSTNLNEFTEGI